MDKNIAYFLKEVNIIREKYLAKNQICEHFNVFSTLLNPTDEVYLHSRFISSILDPKGPHNLRMAPLTLFLNIVNSQLSFSESAMVTPNNETWSEYHEIDILIEDKKLGHAIIIENKINAVDSNHEDSGQLERYYKVLLNDGYKQNNIEVYYLTTDRHEPSDDSVGKSGKYHELAAKIRCIDYSNEITQWLSELVKHVYDKPYIRETINQYIKLIKVMTGDIEIEERKELASLIGKNEDNLASARLLLDNFKHVCWHTIADFFNEFVDALEQCGLNVISQPSIDEINNIVHGGLRNKKVYPTIIIQHKSGIRWAIQAEYDDQTGLYYGIQKNDNRALDKNIKATISQYSNTNQLDKNEFWFYWKYFADSEDQIYLWDFLSYPNTFNLISNEKRKTIIAEYITKIQDEIKTLEAIL